MKSIYSIMLLSLACVAGFAESPVERYVREEFGFNLGLVPFGASATNFPGVKVQPQHPAQVVFVRPGELGLAGDWPASARVAFRSNHVAGVVFEELCIDPLDRPLGRQRLQAFEQLAGKQAGEGSRMQHEDDAFRVTFHGYCNLKEIYFLQLLIEPRTSVKENRRR
jgi:hypothetical protein